MDDDGDDKDDTKRKTRNLSEKKRRDQFNVLVNELSAMVSINNRKMDKSTVLKSTISYLKNHNDIKVRSRAHDVRPEWKPPFLSNEEFTYLLLEALEGFLMVFSATGRVHYVSESVTQLLGHSPAEFVNHSVFDLAHEADRPVLYKLLQSADCALNGPIKDKEVRFQCHLRRGTLDFRDEPSYELIQFYGHFRRSGEQLDGEDRRYQGENTVLYVCTGRLQTPQLIRDVSLIDATRNEFTSRHSLEWKFLFLDHRAPPIIGYLPFEVLGTSGYDYYHFDDLEKVIECHEALLKKGELTSCCYRFLTKGQQWIWLQTRSYITYHQWNSKPEFVDCTHRVVSYADLSKNLKRENETDSASEAENSRPLPSADEPPALMSPPTALEPEGAYAGSFQLVSRSQEVGAQQSPEASAAQPQDDPMATNMSCVSDASDLYPFANYRNQSESASMKSTSASSTAGTVATQSTADPWRHQQHARATSEASCPRPGSVASCHLWPSDVSYQPSETGSYQRPGSAADSYRAESEADSYRPRRGSDVGSESGGSRESQRGGPHRPSTSFGDQSHFLDPASYGVVPSGVPVLPVLPGVRVVPVLLTPDELQLQRKHEELQQMILRQQAELRHVREQLLLARLGILPSLGNAPPMDPQDAQADPALPQISVLPPPPRPSASAEYPPQHPPQ